SARRAVGIAGPADHDLVLGDQTSTTPVASEGVAPPPMTKIRPSFDVAAASPRRAVGIGGAVVHESLDGVYTSTFPIAAVPLPVPPITQTSPFAAFATA